MSKNKVIQVSAIALCCTFASTLNMSNVLANTNPLNNKEISLKQTFNKEEAILNNEEALFMLSLIQPEQFVAYDYTLITSNEAKELQTFVKNEILAGANVTESDSDEKKARTIFNWIAKNIKYASNGEIPQLRPAEIMKHKVAVCGGFSNLYKAMLNTVGIAATYVNGPSVYGAHQWNAVYLDGNWYFSDSTWKNEHDFKQNAQVCGAAKNTTSIYGLAIDGANGTKIGFENGEISVVGVEKRIKHVIIPKMIGSDKQQKAVRGFAISAYNNEIEKIQVHDQVVNIDTNGSAKCLQAIDVDANNQTYASKDGVLYTKDFSELLLYPSAKNATSFTILKETEKFDEKETFKQDYLVDLYVEAGNIKFTSIDGVVYNKDVTKLLTIPNGKSKVVIPASVHDVSTALQAKHKLTHIEFSEGHKVIGFEYFKNTNVKTLVLPASIESIADDAFGYDANGKKNPPADMEVHGRNDIAKNYAEKYHLKYVDLKAQEQLQASLHQQLQNKLDEAEQKLSDEVKYTPASVVVLKEAINDAKELLNKQTLTQAEVDICISMINEAIQNLKLESVTKPEPQPEIKPDVQPDNKPNDQKPTETKPNVDATNTADATSLSTLVTTSIVSMLTMIKSLKGRKD